jgi:hypothetical protein
VNESKLPSWSQKLESRLPCMLYKNLALGGSSRAIALARFVHR